MTTCTKCANCGRKLTNAKSVALGVGPTCAKKVVKAAAPAVRESETFPGLTVERQAVDSSLVLRFTWTDGNAEAVGTWIVEPGYSKLFNISAPIPLDVRVHCAAYARALADRITVAA